jgi:DNA-binding NarL/FixJ family response regulator
MRKRVLIADDHLVWRRGLRDVLEPIFDIVAEASEGNEAVDRAIEATPDVVVMDISMPGMDGIEAVRQIKERLPNTGVVMLSVADADEEIYEAIRAGADGYVLKDDTAESIVQAVENAASGRGYLPPGIAKRVLETVSQVMSGSPHGRSRSSGLTDREIEVLRYIAQGYTNKQIARQLSISERTVGNHVSSIYNKLGIFDRAHATVYAIKHGIIRV